MTEDSALEALCESLKGCGEIVRYSHYRVEGDTPEKDICSIGYDDWSKLVGTVKWTDLFIPHYMCFSDYSGSTVERSNCESFLEDHKGEDGVYETYGGYGTKGVTVRLDAITEEMVDDFQSLQDYPSRSDDNLSELEMELEQEDWDLWIAYGLRLAIEGKFELEELEMDDEKLFSLYLSLKDSTNTYWEAESAVGGHVDIARLLEDLTREML